RPVDADGHAESVRLEKVDDLISEQRAVGSEREINLLARLPALFYSVGYNLAHELEVEQRLAAKEDDVHLTALAGLLEEKVHAGAGRVPVHLHGRGTVLGRFGLVAVGTVQIALVGDVDDGRAEGKVFHVNDRQGRRGRGLRGGKDAQVHEFLYGLGHFLRGKLAGQRLGELRESAARLGLGIAQDRLGERVHHKEGHTLSGYEDCLLAMGHRVRVLRPELEFHGFPLVLTLPNRLKIQYD